MSPTVTRIESDIAQCRRDLDAWLKRAYAGIDGFQFNGEVDASYSNWHVIEALAGSVFDHGLTQQLHTDSIDSLLFFISRSDELGSIIAWLTPTMGSPMSHCGKLSYPDYLYLCEQAVVRPDDYCDYQLAACFRKCESLDDDAITILKGFFNKTDSYTRRMALHSFEQFAHPLTIDLAIDLWRSDDCEFAKLSCLHALKRFSDAKHVFDAWLQEYQAAYDVNAEEYRQSHLRQLTSGSPDGYRMRM